MYAHMYVCTCTYVPMYVPLYAHDIPIRVARLYCEWNILFICYGHLDILWTFSTFSGHLVNVVVYMLAYFFPFWDVVPLNIWQP
jgi:hypothetical protein